MMSFSYLFENEQTRHFPQFAEDIFYANDTRGPNSFSFLADGIKAPFKKLGYDILKYVGTPLAAYTSIKLYGAYKDARRNHRLDQMLSDWEKEQKARRALYA